MFLAVAGPSISYSSILENVPDYKWYKGCSPTSAGMMMGYYDRNGYGGLGYDDLVPGGTAELSTYPSQSEPYLANDAIDSLGNYMHTTQSGATTFWFLTSGGKLTIEDFMVNENEDRNGDGILDLEQSGMYGIGQYIEQYYAYEPNSLYNQYTDNEVSGGFSFDDFRTEINEGRVVMIHVDGHSMLGYGYDLETQTLFLHDTWTSGPHNMAWGGFYGGEELFGVTCFTLTGGDPVPIPSPVWLLGFGLLALAGFTRRSRENSTPPSFRDRQQDP
jgi:hypothetical protein